MAKKKNSKPKQPNFKRSSRQNFDKIWRFGFHAVQAALNNKNREIFQLLATKNSLDKLGHLTSVTALPIKVVKPTEEEVKLHKNFLKTNLKKNFFN